MTIRHMTIKDYDEVYGLWSCTAGMGMRSLDDSHEGIAKFLTRNPNTCFVAEADYQLVGVILCGHDGRRGYIYHVAVKTEYRKRGIGKTLVEAALCALKEERVNKAALVVYSANEMGNKFWEGIGFEKRDDLVYRNISLNENNI